MLKRIVAVLATAALAVGLALGAGMPASAHTPNYSANCGSLDLNLVAYGVNKANFVTVTIDGTKVENNTKFGDTFTKSYTWAPGTAHDYTIDIKAQDAGYDRVITGTSKACTTTTQCLNPFSSTAKNFTVLTSGSVTLNSTSHVTGTIAAGDDVVVQQGYGTGNNEDGTPLPVVDGRSTGLLVGDQVILNAGGESLKIDAGATRVGNVGSGTASGVRFYPTSDTNKWVRLGTNATTDDIKAPGLWSSTFGSAFTSLTNDSNTIAGYTAANVNFVTAVANGQDGKKVTLNPGVTNVLRITSNDLGGITKLFFDGTAPNATTPFIIDVTSNSTPVTVPVIMNVDPGYVLWNFAKITGTLNLKTSTGNDFVRGSLLAPNADVKLIAGGLEGQIAAKTLTVTTGSEVHHFQYKPCVTAPTDVKGSASATPQVCDANYVVQQGAVTANAATGVTYELWSADKSTKIATLTAGTPYQAANGDYVVKVLPASSSYTVSAANTWIPVTIAALTGGCTAPTPVKGAATTTDQVCDAKDYVLRQGTVTATAKTGVVYELWSADKSTKIADLTAGSAYKVASGSYAVKVLPASAAYTVAAGDQWIAVTVAPFTGDCTAPTPVKGAATTTAQVCDVNYDLRQGSVTATAKTGVVYQLWSADKATKLADLTAGSAYQVASGDYYVRVLAASKAYTVASGDEWIAVTVAPYTGVCAQTVTGAATASAEVCDTNYDVQQGSVTATAKTGVTYELWTADQATKIATLTAGTPYRVDGGDYVVKVLPASSKYVVDPSNQWIAVTVADYTGVCAQTVTGAATTSAEVCDANYDVQQGAVTATVKTGVRYELWTADKATRIAGLTAGSAYKVDAGDYVVKVVPATSKYYVDPADEWLPVTVGDYTGICAEAVTGAATTSAEVCTVDYTVQPGTVTATVVSGVKYELWSADKTTKIADLTAGTPYQTAGGTYFVKVLPATAKQYVASSDEWIEVTVGAYTGDCTAPTRVSGAAVTSGEVCETAPYQVTQGSITPSVATGVRYELWTADRASKIADLTAGSPYKVDGGSYVVKVIPTSAKFTVDPADTWIPADVAVNTTVCNVIGDPVQLQECVARPGDPLTSDWTAKLTIVSAQHVQYRVFFQDGTNWVDQGVWAAGSYDAGTTKLPYATTVRVVAEAEAGWNLLAPKSWTYTFTKAFDCNLPTGGVVTPTVTFSESCSVGQTYTLAIDGGVAGTVLWSVNGGPQTTQLGTFAIPSTGKVTIVATPATGSGFDGDGLPRTFTRTFSSSVLCDLETLALTGQNVAGPTLLAIVLLQAGLVLVAVRFVRARRARHLV